VQVTDNPANPAFYSSEWGLFHGFHCFRSFEIKPSQLDEQLTGGLSALVLKNRQAKYACSVEAAKFLLVECAAIIQRWIDGSISTKRFCELYREWTCIATSIDRRRSLARHSQESAGRQRELNALIDRIKFTDQTDLRLIKEAIQQLSERSLGGDDGRQIREAMCRRIKAHLKQCRDTSVPSPGVTPSLSGIFGPSWCPETQV
jgi:hypothetical protein